MRSLSGWLVWCVTLSTPVVAAKGAWARSAVEGTRPGNVANCVEDRDHDGVEDALDNCPRDANLDQLDQDLDGQGNVCDQDVDGDGVSNMRDVCPATADNQVDSDRDGAGDVCDEDDDGDGVPDVQDNCLGLNNPAQLDQDNDGAGDACDVDADGDLVLDRVDNCVGVPNRGQFDFDRDGRGDVCDVDSDGDGVPNEKDHCPTTALRRRTTKDGCGGAELVASRCLPGTARNREDHMVCVIHHARVATQARLLTEAERAALVSHAVRGR